MKSWLESQDNDLLIPTLKEFSVFQKFFENQHIALAPDLAIVQAHAVFQKNLRDTGSVSAALASISMQDLREWISKCADCCAATQTEPPAQSPRVFAELASGEVDHARKKKRRFDAPCLVDRLAISAGSDAHVAKLLGGALQTYLYRLDETCVKDTSRLAPIAMEIGGAAAAYKSNLALGVEKDELTTLFAHWSTHCW